MNKQRQAVYGMRRQLIEGKDQKDRILEIINGIVGSFIDTRCPERAHVSNYELAALQSDVLSQFGVKLSVAQLSRMTRQEIEEHVLDLVKKRYEEKERFISPDLLRHTERMIMLNVIDNQWKDHLLSMDHLKEASACEATGKKTRWWNIRRNPMSSSGHDGPHRGEATRYLFFLQVSEEPGGGGRPSFPSPRRRKRRNRTKKTSPPSPRHPRTAHRRTNLPGGLHPLHRAQEEREMPPYSSSVAGLFLRPPPRPEGQETRTQRALLLRQRKEVQEMLRILIPALVLAATSVLQAGLWPDGFAGFQKKSAQPPPNSRQAGMGGIRADRGGRGPLCGPGPYAQSGGLPPQGRHRRHGSRPMARRKPRRGRSHHNYVLHFATKAPPQPAWTSWSNSSPGPRIPLASLPNYLPKPAASPAPSASSPAPTLWRVSYPPSPPAWPASSSEPRLSFAASAPAAPSLIWPSSTTPPRPSPASASPNSNASRRPRPAQRPLVALVLSAVSRRPPILYSRR